LQHNPPLLHEELHGLGGGGDIASSSQLIMGGGWGMFDSFRWLDVWLAPLKQGQGSVGEIVYGDLIDMWL
jgi:hypothetical protein